MTCVIRLSAEEHETGKPKPMALILSISIFTAVPKKRIYLEIYMNGIKIEALFDSGARISIIHPRIVGLLKLPLLTNRKVDMILVNKLK